MGWKEDNPEKMRKYRREWYARNREEESRKASERGKKRTKLVREYIRDYKVTKGCQKCGENHPAVLDLHHIDPESKTIMPNRMATQGWSITRVDTELALCVVLCSNCHRKEHYVGVD